MKNSIWGNANVNALVELWDTEKSAAQIAAEIGQGLTKNAIISKAIRMGLPQRTARCTDPIAQAARKDLKREADANRQRIRRGTVNPRVVARALMVSPIESLKVSFAAIGRFQCRWIGNEDMAAPEFCGHPTVDGKSWCAFHANAMKPAPVSAEELERRRQRVKDMARAKAAPRRAFDFESSAAMPVE